jgi:hypothetical protein
MESNRSAARHRSLALLLARCARVFCAAFLMVQAAPAEASRSRKARKQTAAPAPAAALAQGRLRVRVNVAASCTALTMEGALALEVPAGQEVALEVAPGTVRLVCKSPGFDDASVRLEVGADEGVPVRLALPRLEGEEARAAIDLTAGGLTELENGAAAQPGCRARLYLPGGQDVRAALPAAPAETVLLAQLPQVTASGRDPANGGQPNTLLRGLRQGLSNASLYAVVFDGWVQAGATGVHTLAATSDDPVSISLGGRPVLRSDFSAGLSVAGPVLPGQVATTQVQVALTEGRWYRVEITARQRWAPFPWGEDLPQEALDAAASNRGATLRISLGAPGQDPVPLLLSLPASPTASR